MGKRGGREIKSEQSLGLFLLISNRAARKIFKVQKIWRWRENMCV